MLFRSSQNVSIVLNVRDNEINSRDELSEYKDRVANLIETNNQLRDQQDLLKNKIINLQDELKVKTEQMTSLLLENKEKTLLLEQKKDQTEEINQLKEQLDREKKEQLNEIEKLKNELENYHKNNDYDFLIQEKINYQNEVGIFYHRFPDENKGKITGMVKKEFLSVKGNGKSTLKELVMENPRSAFQIKAIEQKMGSEMQKIVPEYEEIVLIPFGSHTRGAKFIDISNEITEILAQKIDEICTNINGFYFGRLDVMFENLESLKQGKNFKIIEINGSKSEPTHMYDPKHSLFFAWKEITKHWKIMAEISRKNHEKGFPYLDIKEGVLALKNNLMVEKKLRKISLVD